jgi:sulfonate dioxygenase
MAPIATTEAANGTTNGSHKSHVPAKVFNPFYSPPSTDENDGTYQFAQYKVSFNDAFRRS